MVCFLEFFFFLIVQHEERPLYHVHMVTSRVFDCATRRKATLPYTYGNFSLMSELFCDFQEERQKRMGPGGLDPVEVFESLPPVSFIFVLLDRGPFYGTTGTLCFGL